jgi:hypothetical protein
MCKEWLLVQNAGHLLMLLMKLKVKFNDVSVISTTNI